MIIKILQMSLILIFCHLVGDYVLQGDFIAKTKGENWYHLFVHSVLYVLPFYVCFGWCWQNLLIFILHFAIDAQKARYNKLNYVQDQILHYAALVMFVVTIFG